MRFSSYTFKRLSELSLNLTLMIKPHCCREKNNSILTNTDVTRRQVEMITNENKYGKLREDSNITASS